MDTEKVNGMIANLAGKRQDLQSRINKKREIILKHQEGIADLEEQVQGIDSNISQIKVRAQKDAEREQSQKPTDKEPNPLDVEEDAAVTTGAMDAASVASPSPSGGNFGGWRHYSKMGDVSKRSVPCSCDTKKKKHKKKKIVEFMNSFWESIEGEK